MRGNLFGGTGVKEVLFLFSFYMEKDEKQASSVGKGNVVPRSAG